jgi:hypothetical protein
MMIAPFVRVNRMHRSLVLFAVAVATIQPCCGCGSSKKPPESRVEVTTVSAPRPPSPKLVHGKANVVGATGEEIPFTLELPPGWTWSDGQAEKVVGTAQTIILSLTATDLPDDEKAEWPSSAARRRLVELPDEKMLNDLASGGKVTIRDRRIIQVGNNDAVWDVVAFQAEEDDQPMRLEARCYLKLGDKTFTLEGSHIDTRDGRTATDFDISQAQFLKISQSFRAD